MKQQDGRHEGGKGDKAGGLRRPQVAEVEEVEFPPPSPFRRGSVDSRKQMLSLCVLGGPPSKKSTSSTFRCHGASITKRSEKQRPAQAMGTSMGGLQRCHL